MDITILKKIGLNEKEIKVYLGLLEYGAISVRGLAELIKINRGSVYDILRKLKNMGLVSFYHHETKQKFVAESPEKLYSVVEREERKIEDIKKSFQELIPELKSLQDKGDSRPTSKFYEGKQGIKFILEDVLATLEELKEREYYIYSATNASEDINNAFPGFTNERIKRKIHVKAISLAEGGKLSGLDERCWLGTKEESATYCIVYAGKVAFISRDNQDMPVGVIIENKMIYETQKIIFLELWKLINK